MGRERVQLKRIKNKINRQVTFSKRRSGLLKEAHEISVLCESEVALIVFPAKGKLFEYSTNSRGLTWFLYTASYSLRINCGGEETTIINGTKKIIFGDDMSDFRSSGFVESRYNWGISNTGIFMSDNRTSKSYIWANSSALSVTTNPELYTTARLSALSLTYYGYCLGNGSYTVNLHFAEIMFTNDTTFSSLGRRIFDVYIQGKLVLENFDIVREAGGVGMAVVKSFPVNITDGTFEIRFYWAGKGTNAIPVRGVYGPLISAISVDPDFEPPAQAEEDSNSMSSGGVAGIVAAVLVVILLSF